MPGGGEQVSVVEEARGGRVWPESTSESDGDREVVTSNTDSLRAESVWRLRRKERGNMGD